jgi:hypothetical protein
MADMVVAAGIDAAGDLDLQIADLALPLRIAEAVGNACATGSSAHWRARNSRARAGDDVGDQAGIGVASPAASSAR